MRERLWPSEKQERIDTKFIYTNFNYNEEVLGPISVCKCATIIAVIMGLIVLLGGIKLVVQLSYVCLLLVKIQINDEARRNRRIQLFTMHINGKRR